MDGLPPPPPGYQPSGPTAPAAPPPAPGQTTPVRPVGRPSGDPERDEERAAQKIGISKFVSLLPKDATDHRIAIYKLKGSHGQRHESRPLARILMSELEEAQQNGTEPQDFIIETLMERFGDRPMRVLCVPQDSHGRRITKLAAWETKMNLDDDEDLDDGLDDDTFDLDEVYGTSGMPPHFGGPISTPPPPPPPPGNDGTVLREAKSMIASQREAEQGNTALIISMMQQQAQQQSQNATMMMQMMQTMSVERERRAEDQRREDERREERRRADDEKRTGERLQLIGTMLPALMPLIQRVLEGKEDKITPLLMTKFLEGNKENSSASEMISLMSEASKQQVMSQGEMMRNTMAQQSDMSKSMIAHVLQMAQDSVAAQRKLEENKDGGPMDTFASIMGMLGPLLHSAQGQGQPPAQPQPLAPPQQALPPPQEPPQRPTHPSPAAPPAQEASQPTRETHPDFTDAQWIQGSLGTVAALQQGRLPASQRAEALAWMMQVLPARLLHAIAEQDEATIQEMTAPVVFEDQSLLQWLSQEDAQSFLREAVSEMGAMLRERRASAGRAAPGKPSKIPPPPLEDNTTEDLGLDREEVVDYPPPTQEEHDATFPTAQQEEEQTPEAPHEADEVMLDADAAE